VIYCGYYASFRGERESTVRIAATGLRQDEKIGSHAPSRASKTYLAVARTGGPLNELCKLCNFRSCFVVSPFSVVHLSNADHLKALAERPGRLCGPIGATPLFDVALRLGSDKSCLVKRHRAGRRALAAGQRGHISGGRLSGAR
jgi:hypothetical protein